MNRTLKWYRSINHEMMFVILHFLLSQWESDSIARVVIWDTTILTIQLRLKITFIPKQLSKYLNFSERNHVELTISSWLCTTVTFWNNGVTFGSASLTENFRHLPRWMWLCAIVHRWIMYTPRLVLPWRKPFCSATHVG